MTTHPAQHWVLSNKIISRIKMTFPIYLRNWLTSSKSWFMTLTLGCWKKESLWKVLFPAQLIASVSKFCTVIFSLLPSLSTLKHLKILLVMSTCRHQNDVSRMKIRDEKGEQKSCPYLLSQAWESCFFIIFLMVSLICDISSWNYPPLLVSREKSERLWLTIDIFPDALKKISKNLFV